MNSTSNISRLKNVFSENMPDEYREQFSDIKRKTNLKHTFGLSIFIIAMQIFLNLINMLKPDSGSSDDIMKYVYLSMLMLIIGVLHLILCLLIHKGTIKNMRLKQVLPYSLLYAYVIIQLIFLNFNFENNVWINSYMIALLVLSFFIFRSPIHNTVSIFAVFIITICMMFFTRRENGVWSMVIESDTWATMIIITLLCNYMSIVMYRMYYKNTLNAIHLEKINDKLSLAAKTDALTGLYNRRGFYDQLTNNLFAQKQKKNIIVSTMIDVDNFKQYNDKYGHLEGDACLQSISNVLKNCFDGVDGIVCRYGGEEFLAIFYADSRTDAVELVEKCRMEVSTLHLDDSGERRCNLITISAGMACSAASKEFSVDTLISLADDAVYQAKINGRNNTVLFD